MASGVTIKLLAGEDDRELVELPEDPEPKPGNSGTGRVGWHEARMLRSGTTGTADFAPTTDPTSARPSLRTFAESTATSS